MLVPSHLTGTSDDPLLDGQSKVFDDPTRYDSDDDLVGGESPYVAYATSYASTPNRVGSANAGRSASPWRGRTVQVGRMDATSQ